MEFIVTLEDLNNFFSLRGSRVRHVVKGGGELSLENTTLEEIRKFLGVPQGKKIFSRGIKVKWECSENSDHISTTELGGIVNRNKNAVTPLKCRSCAISNSRGPGYEEFCEVVKKEGYTMISTKKEYAGVLCKMSVDCDQGHRYTTTYNRFTSAKARCPDCYKNEMKVDKTKVKETFKKLGYELMDEYIDNKTPMLCKCTCGRMFKIAYHNASRRDKGTCNGCTRRWKIADVEDYMEEKGCKLIEVDSTEFVLNSNRVKYNCYCDNIYTSTWRMFKDGHRCDKCTREMIRVTSLERYGVDNPSKSEVVKEKIRNVMMERHGVEYAMQNEEFKQRSIESNKSNHGGVFNLNLPEMREKSTKAYKDKYGTKFGFNKEHNKKGREVTKARYGVEYPLESKEIHAKIKKNNFEKYGNGVFLASNAGKELMMELYGNETFLQSETGKKLMIEKYGNEVFLKSETGKRMMIEKYGVENAMQNPTLFKKARTSAFNTKEYKFESGNIVYVQGYEPYALDLLLKSGIEENAIIVDCEEIPVISYNEENKQRRYFPDILVKANPEKGRRKDKIIEVKSIYTYISQLEKNLLKFKATSDLYDFELWVLSPRGDMLIEGKFIGDLFMHFNYD